MREGDIEAVPWLIAYLRDSGRIGPEETPEVRVLRGGVSNRTVWLRRPCGEEWVLKQALRKLRVQAEWFSSPERIRREALGMRWLTTLLPEGTVPRLVFEDPGQFLLAMSAVPPPHRNWKAMLLEGLIEESHVRQFAKLLADLHWRSHLRASEASDAFSDISFFESLRLEPYYEYTATRVAQAAPFITSLVEETHRTKTSLVHGDFSPKNILVHDGRLILLDHEVIHFGDPAFDLGFSLTHLLSKAHHVAVHRMRFANAAGQYWREYVQAVPDLEWSARLEGRAVRHTLACMLARVDGRSPLEYLSEDERAAQRAVVVELMRTPPRAVPELIHDFVRRLP